MTGTRALDAVRAPLAGPGGGLVPHRRPGAALRATGRGRPPGRPGRARLLAAMAIALALATAPAPARGAAPGAGGRIPRIGVLSPFTPAVDPFFARLREGLRELGYLEGRRIALEYRAASGVADRLPGLATELVRAGVDVIVTTTPPGARAARQATATTPIVLAGVDDAVEQGFVGSLARPGGNVTGISWLNTELSAKRLELLTQAIPGVRRVAVLREAVGGAASLGAAERAARALGIRLQVLEVREPGELATAFATIRHDRVGAVLVLQGPMVASHAVEIVDLATRARLPAMFSDARFVELGGLMSYGPRLTDLYRRSALYVDRILRGARAAEIPVEEPTNFELRINLKVVRALRLTIPEPVLLQADIVAD